ncbi:MAG: hypothetical protein U9N46_07325 [Euryarchaeota archaeon]|nr:MAG: hypothetical protein C5S48_01915 [ANME-2 cluster archaeon]MEA1864992.1 hypothetical protein [Euryarchaeota archaeon]
MIYREKYDETITNGELRHINKNRTWKCDTIRSKLGVEFNIDCENCRFCKSAGHGATIAGSAPVECGTATAFDGRLQILDGRLIWTEGGISLACGYESETQQWSYQFFADGVALTRSCTSAKSPCDEEPYRRDPLLRKLLKGCEGVDVDAAMCSIVNFGMHLVRNPEILTEYVGALKPHKKRGSAAVELSEDEIEEAMGMLKNPKLVEIIEVAIHGARLRGEHLNTIITFITMLSTLVAEPLVLHLTGSSAVGKTALVKAVIWLFPDEMLFVRSGVTPKVLYYDADEDETGELVNDLTGCIIILLEEDESRNFVNEIKPLLSHDMRQIVYSFVDKKKNGNKTQHVIVRGFPAFIGLTTQSVFDDQISTRSLIGTPDDSKEKVASIIDDRAHAEVMPWAHGCNDEPTVIQNAIRLLKRVNVIIPFMGVVREYFPHEDPRASRDFGQFISMIQTCTTLHQFQRHRVEVDGVEYVVAHLFDLDLALRMIESLLCETISGIPKDVKKFLDGMIADGGSDYTKTELMKLYRTIMGRNISRNHLTDRYLTLLVNLGVLDVGKVGNAHTYSVCEKQLSLSVMSLELIENLVRDETKERLVSDYLSLADTSLGDTDIPLSEEEIRSMCMSSYVGYQSDRFNGLFNQCLTDEYPRRYLTKCMTDDDRRDEEEESPEDADENDAAPGVQVMQLIGEYVKKYGKQDDHTFSVIAAKIEDEAFGADLIKYVIKKYREGHRIFIPRQESE